MKKRVEIAVDRLVLRGLQPGQGRRVAEAVQRELARLGAEGGLSGRTTAGEIGAALGGAVKGGPRR